MLPSSSRVRLNRVALKDVVGLKLVPRRRRVPKSPSAVAAESRKQEEKVHVPEAESVKDTARGPGSNDPAQSFLSDRVGPENEADTTSTTAEGEPGDKRAGTRGAERRRLCEARRDGGGVALSPEGAAARDTDRNAPPHPSPAGPADSEGSLRRPLKVSRCGLCEDCKHVSPQQKTLGKKGQKSSSPGPEQSMVKLKLKKENPVTETSKKIIIWIGRYPKLALCDVAQKCDSCRDACGYVLPDGFKTKVVHCFKKEMSAGFRFGPSCSGHNDHKSEESALAKNSKLCPSVECVKSARQPRRLTEHQKPLTEHTDAEILSGPTTCHILRGWTSEASATCSASFLSGKRTNKGECRTSMWDRDVEEDPGPGCDLIGAKIRRDKKIKLGESLKDGSLPSTPDLESVRCNDTAKTHSTDRKKTCSGVSDDSRSCLELTSGSCSTCMSTVKETCARSGGQIGEPRKTDAAQMSSELFCQKTGVSENEMDEMDSFTCQRVRVYCRKIHFSCARTYISWPFSASGGTLTAHAGTAACPAEPIHPSAANKRDSSINQNQPGSPCSRTNDTLSIAPTSSDTTHQVSHQNKSEPEEDGEHIVAKRNGKRHGIMASYSSGGKHGEVARNFTEAEESLASLLSGRPLLSTPGQREAASASATPVNGPEADSSMSTPSPSALGLSNWETATTQSPMSSLFTHGSLSSLAATPSSLPPSPSPLEKVKGVELAEVHSASTSPTSSPLKRVIKAAEKPVFFCEETQMTLCCSSPTSSHKSGSFCSCESSLLLRQDGPGSGDEILSDRNPPTLETYYNTRPLKQNHAEPSKQQCVGTTSNEFMLPTLLSPVASPQGHWRASFLPQSHCCPGDDEFNKDEHNLLPGRHMPQIGDGNRRNCEEDLQREGHVNEELERISPEFKTLSPHSSVGDDGGIEKERQDKTDYEAEERGNRSSEQGPLSPKVKADLTSGVVRESHSSPSGDEAQLCSARDEGSGPSRLAGSERVQAKAEAACDARPGVLDEFTAYEQDILLVDVIQDDPELFENLPEESLLKLGPTRVSEVPKARPAEVMKTLLPRIHKAAPEFEQRLTPVTLDLPFDSPDITEEGNSRPWRPQCSSTPSKMQNNTWPATDQQTRNMGQSDANNNHVNGGLESRSQPIQTVNATHSIPPLMTIRNGPWVTNPANLTDFRRQKSNAYCRQYFSESLSCGFKICRFQHVPVEGDEKFCVETVLRFTKNPMCLHKAGAVFAGYYQNNPPGVYFSMPVLLSLLWALLKAGMVSDVFSVLSVCLAHKIVPSHEFLLALFNFVREKDLVGSVPELMQLTLKMAKAGLVLSLDHFDSLKNSAEFQQTVCPNSPVSLSGNHKLSSSAPFPEYLNIAQSVVEIELCAKQEDWKRMGDVFRSICKSIQHANQVEQICGRVAVTLLSESKDKLSLPFAAFAETVCQNEGEGSLIRNFLGRIGVSLMLRYHKTHQWAKGRRVVEVLSMSKVSYSTLKGLFGNEDGASRCYLVTVATELFFLSGSVEGALNTLRENKWFLSSCSWPCERADLDGRSRVLLRLAEKTSHRDTLEVLCNLPGIKEPNDLIDVSRYSPLFNGHLQVCVDRQILPLASDTVDFMLSKNLAVDHAMLQSLLHKLGKQNLWLRAREVFKHSLSVGYYPAVSAPPGCMSLIVPCRLGEVELALAFEMFVTVNATVILQVPEATSSCLSITLKRTQCGESEYLSAGSRLLSAACILQPKLIIHYTAVNSSQEQMFTLDIFSARRWLRHNHLWASEVWTH